MRKTEIINKHSYTGPVDDSVEYIGRGSIFGNPYEIGKDGTRDIVIDRYKNWFQFMLRSKVFSQEVDKLYGKKLLCFCAPKRCHGEIIAEYLNKKYES